MQQVKRETLLKLSPPFIFDWCSMPRRVNRNTLYVWISKTFHFPRWKTLVAPTTLKFRPLTHILSFRCSLFFRNKLFDFNQDCCARSEWSILKKHQISVFFHVVCKLEEMPQSSISHNVQQMDYGRLNTQEVLNQLRKLLFHLF